MRIYQRTGEPIEFVQIFGERNSGTSYLSKLLQANLRKAHNLLGTATSETTPYGSSIFGYKHWFLNWQKLADIKQRKTLFVVIYRNPYTWIRAMMTRPYALTKSIAGRDIQELPNVKLTGHINGKETINEFHPTTGEQLTLFQLRKLKIEHLETLKSKIDNVVYINLEELLQNPADALQELNAGFCSAFSSHLEVVQAAPKPLVREFISPQPFSISEIEVLNTGIDWDAESMIGYERNNYSLGVDSA